VYLYSSGDRVLCLSIVKSLLTSSRSFRFAGSQFNVGDSHARGLFGEVTADGWAYDSSVRLTDVDGGPGVMSALCACICVVDFCGEKVDSKVPCLVYNWNTDAFDPDDTTCEFLINVLMCLFCSSTLSSDLTQWHVYGSMVFDYLAGPPDEWPTSLARHMESRMSRCQRVTFFCHMTAH
jgi:hypothetical protein